MTFYRILFSFDALILLVLGSFFVDALGYSSAGDSFAIWLPILGISGALLAAAQALKRANRPRLAILVLLVPAIPALLFILFFGLLLATNPSWQ
jgi:hypothetical protein